MRAGLLVRQTTDVRVQVANDPTHFPSVTERTPVDAESFQASSLDDAVVDKWGVARGIDGGKTIWFECGLETRM
ncbi:hypothetical protein [Streptomyces massasporeus]|uniref:hypothetical protein n=1 Tax=Streptomyces massasporeus TaxID=67324 RepID=UPI0036B98D9D